MRKDLKLCLLVLLRFLSMCMCSLVVTRTNNSRERSHAKVVVCFHCVNVVCKPSRIQETMMSNKYHFRLQLSACHDTRQRVLVSCLSLKWHLCYNTTLIQNVYVCNGSSQQRQLILRAFVLGSNAVALPWHRPLGVHSFLPTSGCYVSKKKPKPMPKGGGGSSQKAQVRCGRPLLIQ